MRIRFSNRRARAAIIAVALAGQPMAALADATGPYYDRTFVLAADQKCRLFDPVVARALKTAALQARGLAARHGINDIDLAAAAGRAATKANQVSCDDPDLAKVKGRVETAFSGWARMPRMTFSGDRGRWDADRYSLVREGWRLKQSTMTGETPVSVGLIGDADGRQSFVAVVSFVGRSRPYAARLVLRDADKAPRPWLTDALPPEPLRLAVFSAGSAEAGEALLMPGQTQGQAWSFGEAAGEAIAVLDSRETFAVEFLFRDDSVARATFEAGDFNAGRAFVEMGAL